MTDTLQRFLFNEGEVRGELVLIEDTLKSATEGRAYPEPAQQLLAESLSAATLLGGVLKMKGRISLQAKGQGPVTLLMADCSDERGARGLIHTEDSIQNGSIGEQLGHGQLVITIEPDEGQRYQGIVPLESDTLQECLEDYFARSEQLETLILLFASTERAGGLMLQKMPGYETTEDDDLWNRLTQLARTTSQEELLSVAPETLLHRLFHEESLSLYPAEPVFFHCHCTRERTANALETLGAKECYDLLAEQGEISVDCQFCNQQYRFGQEDIEALFGPHQRH
ncbi:Hsp33 family molecular chaperone HslO [Halomonadaceae bacterium KBTZ08]